MTDKAVALSTQYLDAVKLRFDATLLDDGDALVVPDRVTPTSVWKLAEDLSDILGGDAGERSCEAVAAYGGNGAKVQSVAFGPTSDFKTTAKVGRLYSDRTVYWDILGLKCIGVRRKLQEYKVPPLALPEETATDLAIFASNVLSLHRLVLDGAAVVLPHPLGWHWSDEASQAKRAAARGSLGVFLGTPFGSTLATTLAVAERLALHPYTLEDLPSLSSVSGNLGLALSRENRLLQRTFSKFILDAEFEYLEAVSVAQFHKLLQSHEYVAQEIQTLIGDLGGKTDAQWNKRLGYTMERLARAVREQNAKVRKRVSRAAGSAALDLADRFLPLRGTFAVVGALADVAEEFAAEETLFPGATVVAFFRQAQWVSENLQVSIPGAEDGGNGAE